MLGKIAHLCASEYEIVWVTPATSDPCASEPAAFKGFPACLKERSIRLFSQWFGLVFFFFGSDVPALTDVLPFSSSGLAPKKAAITEVRCVKLALKTPC